MICSLRHCLKGSLSTIVYLPRHDYYVVLFLNVNIFYVSTAETFDQLMGSVSFRHPLRIWYMSLTEVVSPIQSRHSGVYFIIHSINGTIIIRCHDATKCYPPVRLRTKKMKNFKVEINLNSRPDENSQVPYIYKTLEMPNNSELWFSIRVTHTVFDRFEPISFKVAVVLV